MGRDAMGMTSRVWGRLAPSGLRQSLSEERRQRAVGANTRRVLTPPPPSAFGAFGAQSVIVPPARVTSPDRIFIGERVIIHEHAWLSVVEAVPGYTPRLTIGDRTIIDRLAHIACVGEIEIAADVLIGERVLIGDTYHRYDDVTRPIIEQPMAEPRPVRIGAGCGIGLGAAIMPGVTIGENSYVAAGALVIRDVPPRSILAGNPGRVVRRWNEEKQSW
jgi:acetyltransferase-like isoleucine patch superfamily enzyme